MKYGLMLYFDASVNGLFDEINTQIDIGKNIHYERKKKLFNNIEKKLQCAETFIGKIKNEE